MSGADVSQDVQTVLQVKRPDQQAEQLLPDFYAENMTNAMNRDRRKKVRRRGRGGLEGMISVQLHTIMC